MKLLNVYTDNGYLIIETDEGIRQQSLNWRGVDRLQEKARRLIGKDIVTTTSGSWDPCVWFATVDEVRLPRATAGVAPTPHGQPSDARRCEADAGSTLQLRAMTNDLAAQRSPISRARPLDNVVKIYGPPGTGKTRTLLEKVKEALSSGVQPDEVGFFSYTNKATDEAKSRMVDAFPQFDIDQDFPYFQTLHSLAVQSLRTRVVVITDEQAKDFDESVVIERPLMKEGDESSRVVRVKHPVLDVSGTARVMKVPLRRYLAEMPETQRWPVNKWLGKRKRHWEQPLIESEIQDCVAYSERYECYKQSLGVIDYTDMLERALQRDAVLPTLKLLLIDEAQDLNPLQWDLARILIDRAERCYVAGDDDQAICESFGASAKHFVELPVNSNNDIVLDNSHRVPPAVHQALEPLVKTLSYRYPYRRVKAWNPKAHSRHGRVGQFATTQAFLEAVVLGNCRRQEKSLLLMFATNATLKQVSARLMAKGVSHYAANRLEGSGDPQIRLLTVWGAKGGEAHIAALIAESEMDYKMLGDDPRLQYVAYTRALEECYFVGTGNAGISLAQAVQ